jgi:HSP90 family molecular chaperone
VIPTLPPYDEPMKWTHREILQKTKVLNVINKRLVRKSPDMILDIMNDEDDAKYTSFWNNFGKYLKVGVIEEDRYRNDLLPMMRFFSSYSGEEYTMWPPRASKTPKCLQL